MNENLKLRTSVALKITRIIIFLIFAFLILCAIEGIRGDLIKEPDTSAYVQTLYEEVVG